MTDVKTYMKQNVTVPNLLSLLRIMIIAPMVYYYLYEQYALAGLMLVISALSDMFDGIIARKFNQITRLGKILDPVADKLTLIAVIICMEIMYPYILLFVLIMSVKEVLMLCGGAVLIKMKIKPPAAKWYGKAATAVFYVSVTLIVLLRAVWNIRNVALTAILIAATCFFMVFALLNYAILFFHLIKDHKTAPAAESMVQPEN